MIVIILAFKLKQFGFKFKGNFIEVLKKSWLIEPWDVNAYFDGAELRKDKELKLRSGRRVGLLGLFRIVLGMDDKFGDKIFELIGLREAFGEFNPRNCYFISFFVNRLNFKILVVRNGKPLYFNRQVQWVQITFLLEGWGLFWTNFNGLFVANFLKILVHCVRNVQDRRWHSNLFLWGFTLITTWKNGCFVLISLILKIVN